MRVCFGEHRLDTEARSLERGGRRVQVQAKAFDLLTYLIERRERVVSADELLDVLWPGVHVTPAALSTAVLKARHAVGDDGEHQAVIRTERGQGFRFVAEVVEELRGQVPAAQGPVGPGARWAAGAAGLAALLIAAVLVWLAQRPGPAGPSGPALAVLPFANLSADPEQAYFADGIAEELLNSLAQMPGLRVVGRTSSFSFRDSDADVKTIGEALGVDVILEGSVQKAADRVRITAQLIDADDGFQRWSQVYDRELTDLLAIQTEIASQIATALRVNLTAEQRERLQTPPTENLAAYQAYVLGRQRVAKWNTAAVAEAAQYFQQAVELDPSFALAHVGLADAYAWQATISGLPRDEMLAKARAAVERAIELDDGLGQAYSMLAGIQRQEGDFEGAEQTYQRALELSPNDADTYTYYGFLLRDWGRPQEALALHQTGLQLDPLSGIAIVNVGHDLNALGRHEEALAQYERVLEVDPDYSGLWVIADHYWYVEGRLDEAAVWYAKSLALDPESPIFTEALGTLFLDLGDPDRAEHWIERSLELGPEHLFPNSAMQLLGAYRRDEAMAWDYGRKALELWWGGPGTGDWPELTFLRDHELRAGRYSEARALYEASHPELLNGEIPEVSGRNYQTAIDLALVLSRTGEQEQADVLLDRSLRYLESRSHRCAAEAAIPEVQIHALQGEKRKALSALRQAIDAGWRNLWWYYLELDPNLESLHDEPEYQAMLEEIRADMAAQLERVREMEQSGELMLASELASPAG